MVVALGSFFLSFFVTGRAHADDPVPLVLEYTARAGCPGADRFLGDVAARTSLFRRAQQNEPAITLTVSIQAIPGGDRGSLRIESTDGVISARQVSAADCEQVVSALALMTALALDPNASTGTVNAAPPPPPKVAPPPAKAPEVVPPPRAPPTRWRFRAGVALEVLTGVAPEPMVLVRPSVELGSSGASAWSSAVRLSLGVGHAAVNTREGGATFDLLGARVEACPARWRAAPAIQLAPCAAVDAGRLQVAGVGVAPAEQVSPLWVAAGVTGRLEWEIVDAVVAELQGEVLFPLTRSRFFVNEDDTIHRTPAVAVGAAAGLGVRFP